MLRYRKNFEYDYETIMSLISVLKYNGDHLCLLIEWWSINESGQGVYVCVLVHHHYLQLLSSVSSKLKVFLLQLIKIGMLIKTQKYIVTIYYTYYYL